MAGDEKTSILIVEDDAPTLRYHVRIVESNGWKALPADRGEKAIGLAKAHRPRIAIVDLCLPGMDGYELCRRLLGLPNPPGVLVVSGVFGQEDDGLKAYQNGAAAFHLKPLRPIEFAAEIRRFLSPLIPFPVMGRSNGESSAKGNSPVLIIEDDDEQAKAIAAHLEISGFTPYVERTAARGIMAACRLLPHAVILDMGLPDLSGAVLVRILKSHPRTKEIPLLVWTGSQKSGQELECLKLGADDYLVKSLHDMAAIPVRVTRALSGANSPRKIIRAGAVAVDRSSRCAHVSGKPMDLTPMEFDLMAFLVERSPAILRWEEIVREVWKAPSKSPMLSYAPETVDVHVRRLRTKLGKAGSCLITHKGVGVQLDPAEA